MLHVLYTVSDHSVLGVGCVISKELGVMCHHLLAINVCSETIIDI